MAKTTNAEGWCMKCNRMLSASEFYKSPNPSHTGGLLPYCKECLKYMCRDNIKELGSLQSALWVTLAEAGIPYIQRVADDMQEKIEAKQGENINYVTTNTNYVGNYLKSFATIKKNKDKWETIKDTDVPMGDIVSLKERKDKIQAELDAFKLDWGDFSDEEDYAFLEYRYGIYTDGIPLKPAQETLYRKLCIAELNARKVEAKGESTKDVQKQILDLMAKLKIDNFAEVKDKDLTEQLLERQILMHEKQQPMEFYDQKELYEDACGLADGWNRIKRGLLNFVLGHKDYPKVTDGGVSDG